MRTLRWVALFLVLSAGAAALGLWWAVCWVEGPAGAAWLSQKATEAIQESAKGTEVALEGVRIRGEGRLGARVEIARALWREPGGAQLAEISPLEIHLRPAGRRPRLLWEARGEVLQLDLAGVDRRIAKGQWKASGAMAGPVGLAGEGSQLKELDVRLEAIPPGGSLSSELLQGLVAMMPAGSTQATLIQALAGKALFHFNTGRVEMITEPERYTLHLRVDGDHLLNIRVRVPKESIEILKSLFL